MRRRERARGVVGVCACDDDCDVELDGAVIDDDDDERGECNLSLSSAAIVDEAEDPLITTTTTMTIKQR